MSPVVESRCLDWRREHNMCPHSLRFSWRGNTEPVWGDLPATEAVRAWVADCIAAGHRVELRATRAGRREVARL